MKKISLLACLFLSTSLLAQNYATAIGINSGYPGYGSFNVKKFVGTPDFAIDFMIGTNLDRDASSRYLWGQCLFEKNMNIVNTSGFNWYFGGGPSLGYWWKGGYTYKSKSYSGLWIAADGIVGIEYTFSAIPLNIAFEAGPSIYVIPVFRPSGLGNIAIRYAIQ